MIKNIDGVVIDLDQVAAVDKISVDLFRGTNDRFKMEASFAIWLKGGSKIMIRSEEIFDDEALSSTKEHQVRTAANLLRVDVLSGAFGSAYEG